MMAQSIDAYKKVAFFLKFHWNLLPKIQLTTSKEWFEWWFDTKSIVQMLSASARCVFFYVKVAVLRYVIKWADQITTMTS